MVNVHASPPGPEIPLPHRSGRLRSGTTPNSDYELGRPPQPTSRDMEPAGAALELLQPLHRRAGSSPAQRERCDGDQPASPPATTGTRGVHAQNNPTTTPIGAAALAVRDTSESNSTTSLPALTSFAPSGRHDTAPAVQSPVPARRELHRPAPVGPPPRRTRELPARWLLRHFSLETASPSHLCSYGWMTDILGRPLALCRLSSSARRSFGHPQQLTQAPPHPQSPSPSTSSGPASFAEKNPRRFRTFSRRYSASGVRRVPAAPFRSGTR